MPIYTPDRLSKLPKDPMAGLVSICDLFVLVDESNNENGEGDVNDYIEQYSMLRAYCKRFGYNYSLDDIPLESNNVIGFIRTMFAHVSSEARIETQKIKAQKFESFFDNYFSAEVGFELTDGDISEIHRLTSDLRSRITQTLVLDEKHKQRILSRLESMQAEIHKKLSDFDRITGTMYEVLSVIKKAGESAEPWMRIVRQVLIIIWASQGRVYELPSSAPMDFLPNEDSDSTED
jgi:hypothetical protein